MQSLIGTSATDIPASPNQSPGVSRSAVSYEFDAFRLDPTNRLLTYSGKEVPLPGRAFDVLLMLVSRPGALLTKEVLLTSVWDGSFVEESNLTVAISTLRRALNEDPHERRFIQTVARRGYRFIAEVREVQEPERAATISPAAPATELPPPTPPVAEPAARARIWPVAAVVVLLIAGLLAGSWFLLRPREPIGTLAVLPFTMTTPSTTDAQSSEVVLLGITDGLISRLEGEMVVRPTSSVLRYSGLPETGTPIDPVAAGREQGVDAVLTGSLDNSNGHATLKLRLIRVHDGLTLWQNSFQGGSQGLSKLEQDAGNAAAAELHHLGVTTAPSTACARASTTSGSRSPPTPTTPRPTRGWPIPTRCWRRFRSSRAAPLTRTHGRRRSPPFSSTPRWPSPTPRSA
jgi:DNA-binding winged helix-turn-helix (wHTH) protein/TolB-like protein